VLQLAGLQALRCPLARLRCGRKRCFARRDTSERHLPPLYHPCAQISMWGLRRAARAAPREQGIPPRSSLSVGAVATHWSSTRAAWPPCRGQPFAVSPPAPGLWSSCCATPPLPLSPQYSLRVLRVLCVDCCLAQPHRPCVLRTRAWRAVNLTLAAPLVGAGAAAPHPHSHPAHPSHADCSVTSTRAAFAALATQRHATVGAVKTLPRGPRVRAPPRRQRASPQSQQPTRTPPTAAVPSPPSHAGEHRLRTQRCT
jgi:hypothetical protein